MDDAWDPFAVDDSAPAATSAVSGKAEANGGGPQRLSRAEEERIAKCLYEMFLEECPWNKIVSMKPDLGWHLPSYDEKDWTHHDVKFQVSDGIAYIILNRPKENNSLQDTIGGGINDALFALHGNPDFRIAVFTGEGAMFCAGGDPKNWQANAARLRGEVVDGDGTVGVRVPLKEPTKEQINGTAWLQMRAATSGAYGDVHFTEIGVGMLGAAKQWHTWVTVPQFSICLANGSAMGGGVGMTCMCDYVIAVKKCFLVVSEVRIGVIPATISPYVCAKIGASNAKRMFNTAENLKAAERASEIGIVNDVVENMKQGHERVKEIAKEIQPCAPACLASIKELIFTVSGQPLLDNIMFYTALKAAESLAHKESQQGREAELKGEKKPWELSIINPLF